MEKTQVRVPGRQGLDLTLASKIARAAQRFRSQVRLSVGERVSDATSILGLVVLCATLNSAVLIEADGEDAHEALLAVAACFAAIDTTPA